MSNIKCNLKRGKGTNFLKVTYPPAPFPCVFIEGRGIEKEGLKPLLNTLPIE
jgi:hypothetical protein